MKKSPKRTLKNLAKVGAVVGGLVFGLYHTSEKIGYIQHDVQKELIDNLGKKEILKDQETNDIIKLMSGIISQEGFDAMLKRHGYENDSIKINSIITPDIALYKTILEMQTKYGNPKVSFSGNFKNHEIGGNNQPQRAHFFPVTNTIGIHQLDSVIINFNDVDNKEHLSKISATGIKDLVANTWQQYLLNNRMAEIVHAKQLKENGLIKIAINGVFDDAVSGYNYNKTYEIPGAEEYQAHKEYEPMLIQEFIQIYEKYGGTSNECLRNLVRFNSGFFKKFKNEDASYKYLNILSTKGDNEANYLLAKHYFDTYTNFFGPTGGHSTLTNQNIFGKNYTADVFLNEVLDRFKKTYYLGNTNAGIELISIAYNNSKSGENLDLIIEIGEDILKNNIDTVENSQLSIICTYMENVYRKKNDLINSTKYGKMSEEFASQ